MHEHVRRQDQARQRVAYVLPVYDEADNVAAFHHALVNAANARPDLEFEFIYVDDGSRDASLDGLIELRRADNRVTVLSLSRNFGHQIAVTAGLDLATEADAVIVMDTDLQDPPARQPRDDRDVGGRRRRRLRPAAQPPRQLVQAGDRVRLLLGARPAGVHRDPAQRRRLPADGPPRGRGGRPLPRARPVPARHRRARRLPPRGAAVRPRPALRGQHAATRCARCSRSRPTASSASRPRR